MKEKIFYFIIVMAGILLDGCSGGKKHSETPPIPIKAYNIDYNWGPGGAHGFARPGLWADADPDSLMKWYEDLGYNEKRSDKGGLSLPFRFQNIAFDRLTLIIYEMQLNRFSYLIIH